MLSPKTVYRNKVTIKILLQEIPQPRFEEYKNESSPTELPSFGKKHFEPDGSAEQEKQIETFISDIKNIISHKPLKLFDSVSQAVWHTELQLGEIIRQTGSHWKCMGHQIGSKLYIHPEEALFLLETGSLEVFYNELPLSVQRAYFLFFNSKSNLTIEKYRVYSHLSSLGYKVIRHSPQNTTTKYEKDLKVQNINITLKQSSSTLEVEKKIEKLYDNNTSTFRKKLKTDDKGYFPIPYGEECDVKEILKKAQVIQLCDDNVETSLNFDFDVFKKSFKKSCLQVPDYRVVIHRSEDPVLDFREIRSLNHKYNDGVPVIQAVVFSDYIAFCEITAAKIPDILE